MRISTKLISLALATVVIGGGFNISASASESEAPIKNIDISENQEIIEISNQENVGVNEVEPGIGDPNQIVPYGTSKPTSTWNLSTKGRYTFSGYLTSVRSLYTNYLLTGKSSVSIYVRNNGTTSMKFKVMRKDLVFDNQVGSTYQVSAGKSGTVTVTLDSSKNYYIEFLGPCDFNGYIQ